MENENPLPDDAHQLGHLIIEHKLSQVDRAGFNLLLDIAKRAGIIDRGEPDNMPYLIGLLNLAHHRWMWLRDPTKWSPKTKNRNRKFSLLVRYLMAKYDVPKFFDKPWKEMTEQSETYRQWFINLGMGENIRKQKGLPLELTKKMAHNFLKAPSHLSINEALRWGQVIGLGGDKKVAKGVLSTPLGRSFSNEDFWISVIRFFIDNPFLDPSQYGSIYDYLNMKRFVSMGRRWINNVLVDLGPEQPNLSMKRRDPLALLEQVERWHENLRRENWWGSTQWTWGSCGIDGFTLKGNDKKKQVSYQITELLSSQELREEGNAMHHCVASYASSCREGKKAIYSLVKTDGGGSIRELTIEVEVGTRCITQARKKHNELPTEEDLNVMDIWKNSVGLTSSRWLRC